MADQTELEKLYRESQQALKGRDYVRASELLTQILVFDDNFKDASRLLARIVKEKRRRWYNDVRIGGVLGLLLLIGAGFFIAPKLSSYYTAKPSTSVINPTTTPSPITFANTTVTATLPVSPSPSPTPIPMIWKRISIGQEFERDAVTAFATDKKDPDVFYSAMNNAGVYKTIDGGASWHPAHFGLSNTQVESLLIDSQNPRTLYAGTIGGVFKTEDGAENWHRIGEGTSLLMDIKDNSHLYARDENGIYETRDQGNTWITVYALKKECPDAISSWAIHPADGNMLFIAGGETCAGVYKSSDSGHSWTLLGMEDKPNINALAIGLDDQGNYSIYLFPPTFVAEWKIYILHNGDSNWPFAQVMRCDILSSDPDNLSTIYCATSGTALYVTQGKGDSWQAIPGTQSIAYSAIHIDHPNGTDRIIAGGRTLARDQIRERPGVGIFISADGGTSWVEQNNGLGSARTELKIDPMDNTKMYLATYYVETEQGTSCSLYRSLDSGKNWGSIASEWQAPSWCGPVFDGANVLYRMELGSLQKSWNGGEEWLWNYSGLRGKERTEEAIKRLANRLPSYFRDGVYYEDSQSVSANPYINGLVYDVSETIYYSTDAGASWQLSTGSESAWDARLFYTDQSKMIYAIGRTHQSYSIDNGKTWQACGKNVTTSRSDSRLALDLQDSRLYLASSGDGVLISTDNCQSWQASNEGLSNLYVNTLAIDPNDSNKVYAGTDGGAYISYNGGKTWGEVNDGLLGATVVYSIVVDKDSNVYAATPYGVFKLESK